MRMNYVTAIAGAMLAACSVCYSAAPATQASDRSAKLAAYVNSIVQQLATRDQVTGDALLIRLSFAPPDAFPLIEAAAKNPATNPDAVTWLKMFVAQNYKSQPALIRLAKARQEQLEWNRSTATDAYEKAGAKNAKWDASAREAIKLYYSGVRGSAGPAAAAAEKAIGAGCNDPFILYIEARILQSHGARDPVALDQLYQQASDGMQKSAYPGFRQIQCYMSAFQYGSEVVSAGTKPGEAMALKDQVRLQTLITRTVDVFPDFLAGNPPPEIVLETANQLVEMVSPSLHKTVYDAIYQAWQKAWPDHSYLLTFTGQFYTTYAWDARGSGYANTVTQQGWADMRDRLAVAAGALTAAWEKDNNNARAATAMISVELGQGQGRDRMELWYKRAMEADPDNEQAVNAKMYYLEPKWHGSVNDMAFFATDLYNQKNWRAGFPLRMATVNDEIGPLMQSPQAYFLRPEIWKTIERVYVPYLAAFPEPGIRSAYCYRACRSGRWDIAKEQFKLLGDQAVAEQFGGEEAMKAMKARAEQ